VKEILEDVERWRENGEKVSSGTMPNRLLTTTKKNSETSSGT